MPTEPHTFGYPLQQSLDVVRDADRMRGVLSAVTPQYVATLHEAVTETGLVLDLVLTPQVWETVTSVHGGEFRTLFESDTVTLRCTDESVPYAVWTVGTDGETTSCVVVYTDAGVEGVLTNDTAAMNEWALDVFETYSQGATIPEEFASTST